MIKNYSVILNLELDLSLHFKRNNVQLSKIAQILNLPFLVHNDREVDWLLTDSRSLTFPTETLFFALKTKRNDGHNYIQDIYNQGVRAFVVSDRHPEFDEMPDAEFIGVEDSLQALQQLVAAYRQHFNLPVIGITGSNGKTIVKEWLFQMLKDDLKVVRSPRSYNSQIGVPLSVWQLKPDTDLAIFEAGISMPGEMQRLEPIIRPTIGIFTNIGDAHQENFENKKQKIKEKLKLFVSTDVLIYNSDYQLIDDEVKQENLKAQLISWGHRADNYLQLHSIHQTSDKTQVNASAQNVNFTFCIPFTDDASVENALHCITYMVYADYSEDVINQALAKLESVAMRLEVKQGLRDILLINDSYNSDINSLSIAMDFLSQQAVSKQLAKTLILSDIMESGLSSELLYQQVADLIHAKKIEKLIGIGKELTQNQHLFTDVVSHFFQDTDEFLDSALLSSFNQEAILIKGSRKFGFERIAHRLEFTAHETVLEVNLSHLIENLNYFRAKLDSQTKVMCMVKAFAYGSGSVEIAKVLQHHKVDYLAVAVADEGAELRRSGIRIPIVVMNPEKSAFDVLIEHNLEPEIYSLHLLHDFIEAVGKQGLSDYPIHIKIDSGMHRLGFEPDKIDNLIELLQAKNQVKVRSVFSHLAAADDAKLDDFTNEQIAVYQDVANKFDQAFSHKIYHHILNSAGIERFTDYQMDMVRLGIGHYGISALLNVQLKAVSSLKTIILQIKNVKAGETVGYNRNGKVHEDKQIAVLPIGYADGFNRKLGNGRGKVFINGQFAPVIGNVSMDLISVDVTNMQVKEGEKVEIFGDNIRIEELAAQLDTIPYEILTNISRRVKRLYFQE